MHALSNRLTAPISTHLASLPAAWRAILDAEAPRVALAALDGWITQRLADGAVIYPDDPFHVLRALTPSQVRVVILGQDPYHGPGQAQGLAFSVPDACKRPPSLRNIFKEIIRTLPGQALPEGNDLSNWVKQGVLLLNTALTVEDGHAGSHARRGWETVTDALIAAVAADPTPKAFLLWGNPAQAKRHLIAPHPTHLVLTSNHPSPLSALRPPAPFLGNGHFEQVNAWLTTHGREPISWMAVGDPTAPASRTLFDS